jgi:hypothetical protein
MVKREGGRDNYTLRLDTLWPAHNHDNDGFFNKIAISLVANAVFKR